jgi:hypothetical protein
MAQGGNLFFWEKEKVSPLSPLPKENHGNQLRCLPAKDVCFKFWATSVHIINNLPSRKSKKTYSRRNESPAVYGSGGTPPARRSNPQINS